MEPMNRTRNLRLNPLNGHFKQVETKRRAPNYTPQEEQRPQHRCQYWVSSVRRVPPEPNGRAVLQRSHAQPRGTKAVTPTLHGHDRRQLYLNKEIGIAPRRPRTRIQSNLRNHIGELQDQRSQEVQSIGSKPSWVFLVQD